MKAQWLYRQTEGIPALLLPMLTEYTIRDAFHIPQDPEKFTAKNLGCEIINRTMVYFTSIDVH